MADQSGEAGEKKLKILLYNFAQPHVYKGSGGVGIYLANLHSELTRRGHTVVILSSGLQYSLLRRHARLVHGRTGHLSAVVVNSPTVAPATDTFYNLEPYLSSRELSPLVRELRDRYGDIDVFHFQNIEGLTVDFFREVRRAFPSARLIYSAHNYNLVCPQVHLWYKDRELCVDYHDGARCTGCLVDYSRSPHHQAVRPVEAALVGLGLTRDDLVVRLARRATRHLAALVGHLGGARRDRAGAPEVTAEIYRRFRAANVQLMNECFDKVIAVSERTKTILASYGVMERKLAVRYIGTAYQELSTTMPRKAAFETLHLGYIGYARYDKGFFFLLDALESLQGEVAGRMSLTLAVKIETAELRRRLDRLGARFKSFVVHDGYKHAELAGILAPVNLGVVPVIWEDNLPQVAIELIAFGIPVITSDRGGAQEVADNPDFTFKSGDVASLCQKIGDIVERRIPLEAFWRKPMRIYSMGDHVDELMRTYDEDPRQTGADPVAAQA